MNASKMNRHDLLKLVLFLLVRLLSPYLLLSSYYTPVEDETKVQSGFPQTTAYLKYLLLQTKTPLSALDHWSFHLKRLHPLSHE